MTENPKKLTENPNVLSRLRTFASGNEIGWIYPDRSKIWDKNKEANQTFRENEAKHFQAKNLPSTSPKLLNQFSTNSVTGNLLSSDNQTESKDFLDQQNQQKTELLREEAKKIAIQKLESKTYSKSDYPNQNILPGIWKRMSNFGSSKPLKESFLGYLTSLEFKILSQTNV